MSAVVLVLVPVRQFIPYLIICYHISSIWLATAETTYAALAILTIDQ